MIREKVPLKGQRLLEGKEAIPQSAARAISVLLLSGVLRPFFSPYLTGCGGCACTGPAPRRKRRALKQEVERAKTKN